MSYKSTLEIQEDGPSLLKVTGDLDYGNCADFRKHIDKILKKEVDVVVDLSELEYLDSSGLGLLLSLSKEIGAAGHKMVLMTNETVSNILYLTRLTSIFEIAETVEEAEELLVSRKSRLSKEG